MSELLKKFLDRVGTPTELREQLLADEPKEDFDFDAAFKKYQEGRAAVWKSKLKDDITKQVNTKGLVVTKQLSRKLAQSANLDISGNEAEELGFEKVSEMVVEKITSGSGDDSEFKTKYEEVAAKLREWQDKHSKTVKDHETKVAALEADYNKKIAGYDKNQAFATVFKSIEYGVDGKGQKLFESHVRRELEEKWNIAADGALLDLDGTSKAVNLSGEGVYDNLKEPVLEMAKDFGVLKESNGQPGNFRLPNRQNGNGGNGGSGDNGKKFKATSALEARMADYGKKKR